MSKSLREAFENAGHIWQGMIIAFLVLGFLVGFGTMSQPIDMTETANTMIEIFMGFGMIGVLILLGRYLWRRFIPEEANAGLLDFASVWIMIYPRLMLSMYRSPLWVGIMALMYGLITLISGLPFGHALPLLAVILITVIGGQLYTTWATIKIIRDNSSK